MERRGNVLFEFFEHKVFLIYFSKQKSLRDFLKGTEASVVFLNKEWSKRK